MIKKLIRRYNRKRYRRILYINIIVLFMLLVASEFLASKFIKKPYSHIVSSWRLNHTWKPNGRKVHNEWIEKNPEFSSPYTHVYNSQGWLERYDISHEKPKQTYRIFYVGDSFTEGTVPMGQSVPSIVEKRLNELPAKGKRNFEVINTGTSSYSPFIYYILIRYVIMDYNPDLIVVNIDMTDSFDDWKYIQTGVYDEDGNPWAAPERNIYTDPFIDTADGLVKANTWNRLQLFLYQHSYVYNLILKLRSKRPQQKGKQKVHVNYSRSSWLETEWDQNTAEIVDITLDHLKRIAVLCRSRNVKLMYTTVPHYQQYAGSEDGTEPPLCSNRAHYEIKRIAEKSRVPYLNSYEQLKPFIQNTPQTAFYYKGDMHFNPRGYKIWAKAHIEFLMDKRNNLLQEDVYQGL